MFWAAQPVGHRPRPFVDVGGLLQPDTLRRIHTAGSFGSNLSYSFFTTA